MGATFTGSTLEVCGGLLFTVLLAWACVSDLRTRRIPNRLVLALAIGGLLFSSILHGTPLRALAGLLVGFALWIPLYVLGALGAGDVKLFAAASTWLGARGALDGALLAALAGGVLALAMVVRRGALRAHMRSFTTMLITRRLHRTAPVSAAEARTHLPYGIALAAGAALAGWFPPFVW